VFSADGGNLQGNAGTQHLGSPGRVSPEVLNRYPVEVLAIEDAPPSDALSHDRFWVKWIEKCTVPHLPSYIIVAALPKELVEADGLQSKSWRRRFQAWGYEPHYWFLRSTEHGGVVRQDRCMLVLRLLGSTAAPVQVPKQIDTEGAPRTARNMLKPVGIPSASWLKEEWTAREDYPEWVRSAAAPCVLVGESNLRKTPIFSPDGSLPDSVGALIATDRGVRRLLSEELAKAKGVPHAWIAQEYLKPEMVNGLTSLHLWAAVAASLDDTVPTSVRVLSTPSIPVEEEPVWMSRAQMDEPDWEWSPPDLSAEGDWYRA
jgi:hypothetical protein